MELRGAMCKFCLSTLTVEELRAGISIPTYNRNGFAIACRFNITVAVPHEAEGNPAKANELHIASKSIDLCGKGLQVCW